MSGVRNTIYFIGHSNRRIGQFLDFLRAHGIEKIVDVRTVPKSRHNPQFNRDDLRAALARVGIGYAHLASLGGFRRAKKETAVLCAEAVPWRCHRSLIADALMKAGWRVLHIQSRKTAKAHTLTSFLRVRAGKLIYPES